MGEGLLTIRPSLSIFLHNTLFCNKNLLYFRHSWGKVYFRKIYPYKVGAKIQVLGFMCHVSNNRWHMIFFFNIFSLLGHIGGSRDPNQKSSKFIGLKKKGVYGSTQKKCINQWTPKICLINTKVKLTASFKKKNIMFVMQEYDIIIQKDFMRRRHLKFLWFLSPD